MTTDRPARDRRLRRSRDIRAVHTDGRSFAGPLVVVRSRPSDEAVSRIAFVVGRRVGNAVVRNHVRRRFREICRQSPVRPGFDLVVIARPGAATSDFWTLRDAVLGGLGRARALGGRPANAPSASFAAHR